MLVSSLVVYNDYLSVVSSQSDIVLSALLVDNLNSHVFTVDHVWQSFLLVMTAPVIYHGFASLDLFMWRRRLAFRLREICNWQVRWCGWSRMIRCRLTGHFSVVTKFAWTLHIYCILHSLYSTCIIYIYIYIDLWFVCLNGSVSRRYIFRNMRNEIKPRRQEK